MTNFPTAEEIIKAMEQYVASGGSITIDACRSPFHSRRVCPLNTVLAQRGLDTVSEPADFVRLLGVSSNDVFDFFCGLAESSTAHNTRSIGVAVRKHAIYMGWIRP